MVWYNKFSAKNGIQNVSILICILLFELERLYYDVDKYCKL